MTNPQADSGVRAAIYVRISQDHTGQQLGVTRQREDCEDLARTLGWDVAEVYVENDTSAYKKRPQYEQMLADVDSGIVNAIIAWHADRLYRRAVDLGELVEVCKRNNTQIATVRSSTIDLTTPTGRLVAGLLAQVATYEGEAKADRWKRSIRQRREAGVMPGSGPRMKGWTRDGQIVPEEAEEIRWLARQLIEGSSLNALARSARDRGIRSTVGNVMPKQSIKRLLLNPRLAGYSVLKGEIIGTGQWPPILDVETWETVRSLLMTSGSRPAPARVSSLVGLIWCGGCGARMVTGSRVRKAGGLSRTYRCTRDVDGGGCMKVSMSADVVEEIVEAYAAERLSNPRVRERIEGLRSIPRSELAEMSALQDRLVELEQQLDEPGVPVAALVRAMDRTKERIEELAQVVSRSAVVPLPDAREPWPTDVRTRRALVGLVVDRVVIQPSKKPGVVDLERVEIEPR